MADAPTAEAPRPGFLRTLMDVYAAPAEAFPRILTRPSIWLPLVAWMGAFLAANAVVQSKADPREATRAQLEEFGVWEKWSAEQRAEALDGAAQPSVLRLVIGSALGPLVGLVVVSGVSLFVFAFLVGADVTFKSVATAVAWTFLAVALVTLPLTLAVLALKGDWNAPFQTALQANLSLLLDKATTPRVVYVLAESLDLFAAWTVWLLAAGLGAAARRAPRAALPAVIGLWVLWIVFKIGLYVGLPSLMGTGTGQR